MAAEALSIARHHILLIAMAAALVFGWLMTGRYLWMLAPIVGLDWFLINLLNRVTDLREDLRNRIPGTERVERWHRALSVSCWLLLGSSILAIHLVWPALTPWRITVQLIGVAYNFRVLPWPGGPTRLKELYFFKNFGSAVLFVLTCFIYPLAVQGWQTQMSPAGIAVLILFFVPFELSYEVIYDLRDIDGDRAERIPTYPVVHGPERARQIVDGLIAGSALVLLTGLGAGWIGVREGLMVIAPLSQLLFYRPRLRRGLIPADCIGITHLGTAQLLLFLAGTSAWLALGLPENLWVHW